MYASTSKFGKTYKPWEPLETQLIGRIIVKVLNTAYGMRVLLVLDTEPAGMLRNLREEAKTIEPALANATSDEIVAGEIWMVCEKSLEEKFPTGKEHRVKDVRVAFHSCTVKDGKCSWKFKLLE